MKIVLTGGTGLVGNALGPELVRRGHDVTVLTRDPDRARKRLAYPAELVRWRDDVPPPTEAVAGADVIIHLAGEGIADQRWTLERKRALRHSRVRAAENLAASVKHKTSLIISASGVGAFGDRSEEELTEDSAPGTDFLAGLCRDWERAARTIPGERHVILRFGVVLSERGGFLNQVFTPFRLAGASRLGNGRQYLAWIHVDDLVALILRAIETKTMDGVYNAVAPNPIPNADWTRALAKVMRAPAAPPVPALALRLMYGELSTALLGSQRATSSRLKAEGFRFKHPHFAEAVAAIYPDLKAGEFILSRALYVPAAPDAVWSFFSSEKNLERITPPTLKFEVLRTSTPAIEDGTLIDYRLKIHGVPARWRTRIAEWRPPVRFIDDQLKGPYARWHHVHEFEPLKDGVLMKDRVTFKLPMGLLGRLAAAPLVFKDVAKIFDYRAEVIDQIFPRR